MKTMEPRTTQPHPHRWTILWRYANGVPGSNTINLPPDVEFEGVLPPSTTTKESSMTNVNISAPSLLDEHTMGHVLSEMADQTRDDGPLDRAGWHEILTGVGYTEAQTRQILERWIVRCTTCGEDATHLWANVGEDGTIGSMCGPGKFSPSCDNCTGDPSTFETPQVGVLRTPLDFDPERGLRFDDHVGKVAEWLCDRQPDTLGLVLRSMDPGNAREILGLAIKLFAQHVAAASLNEIHSTSFDSVLLDLLGDARGY